MVVKISEVQQYALNTGYTLHSTKLTYTNNPIHCLSVILSSESRLSYWRRTAVDQYAFRTVWRRHSTSHNKLYNLQQNGHLEAKDWPVHV